MFANVLKNHLQNSRPRFQIVNFKLFSLHGLVKLISGELLLRKTINKKMSIASLEKMNKFPWLNGRWFNKVNFLA